VRSLVVRIGAGPIQAAGNPSDLTLSRMHLRTTNDDPADGVRKTISEMPERTMSPPSAFVVRRSMPAEI